MKEKEERKREKRREKEVPYKKRERERQDRYVCMYGWARGGYPNSLSVVAVDPAAAPYYFPRPPFPFSLSYDQT